MIDAIAAYWNERIHDLEMTEAPVGTREFFDDLDEYRFDKLHYLPRLVDFNGYRGRDLLEVGCGIGTDLVRFARGGARVTGVDLSATAIDLARRNFALHDLVPDDLRVENAEVLPFDSDRFDVVYAHGVVQYTADPARLVRECHRVLRPGGTAIFMVYNRVSWLNALSKVMKVPLEHEDAPVLRKFSIDEFRALLAPFPNVRIIPERRPGVPTREVITEGLVAAVRAFGAHPLFRKILDVDPELLLPYVLDRRGASQEALLDMLAAALREGHADGSVRAGHPARQARSVLLIVQSFTLSLRTMADEDDPELAAEAFLGELHDILERTLTP